MIDFSRLVCLDFETYYDSEYTLQKLTTEAYIRDPRFQVHGCGVLGVGWLTPQEFTAWCKTVDWTHTAVLGHHLHFDGLILSHHFGVRPAFLLDTMLMARPIYGAEVGGSLSALMTRFNVGSKGTYLAETKGKRTLTPDEYRQLGEYCLNDCAGTMAVCKELLPDVPNSELELIDSTIRMFTEPQLSVNATVLETMLVEEGTRKAQILANLNTDAKELGSNAKLAEIFTSLGVDPPMKMSPATGNEIYAFAKSDPGMQELLEHQDDQVRAVAEARIEIKSTINESRAKRLLSAGSRGPLPIYLKYWGAHTGRWSGTDGINPQNLRKGSALRSSLEAPPGHVVVAADSAQIEARMVAWLAGDKPLVEAFRSGRDVYCEEGSKYFQREIAVDDVNERFAAKSAVLGLGYGLGWAKFALTMARGLPGKIPPVIFNLSLAARLGAEPVEDEAKALALPRRYPDDVWLTHCAVAKHIVDTYRAEHHRIARLWTDCKALLRAMVDGRRVELGPVRTTRHALILPNGMPLRYPGLTEDGDGFRYIVRKGKSVTPKRIYGGALTENIVQALARIVVGDQMTALRCRPALMTHDEIVFVVPEAEAEAAKARAIEVMSTPPTWAPDLPLSASCKYAADYGGCK